MIISKTWTRYRRGFGTYFYTGWFLFGIIPVYIKRETY